MFIKNFKWEMVEKLRQKFPIIMRINTVYFMQVIVPLTSFLQQLIAPKIIQFIKIFN